MIARSSAGCSPVFIHDFREGDAGAVLCVYHLHIFLSRHRRRRRCRRRRRRRRR